MAKGKKRAAVAAAAGKTNENEEIIPSKIYRSDDPPLRKEKWINKQRVLIFASRGINHRSRHLMINMRTMLPHSKPDTKMEKKESMAVINEICEMKNCNKCIYFEQRKGQDLYMWASNVPNGPSVKFLIENVHTMEELKMTGNCLKGSRPILSFDKTFEEHPQYQLLQELFVQIFGTPNHHPKSQPFVDHVFTFTILDRRIWFRNYQIADETGSLVEIGPRFVLNPIKIFQGSFSGQVLWDNEHYVSPNTHRRMLKKAASNKFVSRVESKLTLQQRRPEESYKLDPLSDVFQGPDLVEPRPKPLKKPTRYKQAKATGKSTTKSVSSAQHKTKKNPSKKARKKAAKKRNQVRKGKGKPATAS